MNNYEFSQHVNTDNKQEVKEYLQAFFDADGTSGLIDALGHIAKKQGMTQVANKAGVNRQNLYRTLKKGSRPDFITINKVVNAVGCKLEIS
jgi:probable addiction module antidote protein